MTDMIQTLFLSMLSMTVLFAVTSSLTLLVRRFIRGRGMRIVWTLVLLLSLFPVRILIPHMSASPVNTVTATAMQTITEQFTETDAADEVPAENTVSAGRKPAAERTEKTEVIKNRYSPARLLNIGAGVLLLLWLVGFLRTIIELFLSYHTLCRSLNAHTEPTTDRHITDIVSDICRSLGQKPIPVRRLDDTTRISPCAVGILAPCIYYGETTVGMEDTSLYAVFLHECLHIWRWDLPFRLYSALILSVFWFYPLRARIFEAICEDLEFGCDEAVLHRLGSDARERYMTALLTVAASVSNGLRQTGIPDPPPFMTFSAAHLVAFPSTKNTLKRRFLFMKTCDNPKTKRRSLLCGTLLLASVVALNTVFLSACGRSAEERMKDANAASDGGVWCYDSFTVALENHFDVISGEEEVTGEQLAEIETIDVYYAENSCNNDVLMAYFSFNGEPVEVTLPRLPSADDHYMTTRALLVMDGASEEVLAAFDAEFTSNTNVWKYNIENKNCTAAKWNAFYCLKTLDDPTLSEEAKAELFTLFPKIAERDLIILDPWITSREEQVLYLYGTEAGFFSQNTVTESAIRTVIGLYPELADVTLTFHEVGSFDYDALGIYNFYGDVSGETDTVSDN